MKVKGIIVFILMAWFIAVAMVGPAAGKSVYLSANHHTGQFDAWNINPTGLVSYQATDTLKYSTDPAGIGIDAVTADTTPIMFISSEFSAGVEIVNPVTLEYIGVSSGPSNIAGIDVDDVDDIVYALLRADNDLYIYKWDPVAKTLTQQAVIALPGMSYGYGLALDDSRNILWVTDTPNDMVRAYDVDVAAWTDIAEIPALSFPVSHPPIDVVVDSKRNLVYTVGAWYGSTLLSRYDVTAGIETTVDVDTAHVGYGGMGVAVEEIKGYVYITSGGMYGSGGGNIQVWDCSTSPFTLLQETPDIGNPAGIAIGNVSYNPPNLAKNDAVVGYGVYIGQTFTYEITFENKDTLNDMTSVIIRDDLPVELDFVSETKDGAPGTGIYESAAHTVTWDIGTIPAGQPGPLVELVVRVNQYAVPDTTIYNYCTIFSDQYEPITVIGKDPDDTTGEPGSHINPQVLVELDIKPQSCPNPFNMGSKGVLPVAILGTEDFDVMEVDPATVLLEGVAPLRYNFEDVSTPVESGADTCECTTEGPDGYMDMTLKFDRQAIASALGTVQDGEMRVLTITGMTYDSIPIQGEDCIRIIDKGKPRLTVESPNEFCLGNNYPNPFNPATSISFNLPNPASWTLKIYNVAGQLVRTFEGYSSGQVSVIWNGKDNSGNEVASGIYFYKLNAGNLTATKKMVLTK